MKYIALLRGINISGKNKISMSELKSEFENNKYIILLESQAKILKRLKNIIILYFGHLI